MKQIYILLLVVVAVVTSCTDDSESTLRGRWQLQSYRLPDSQIVRCDSLFYSFDSGVAQLQNNSSDHHCFGSYLLMNNRLEIALIPGGAYKLPELKQQYHWNDSIRSFEVMKLTSDQMQLMSGDTILLFRAF